MSEGYRVPTDCVMQWLTQSSAPGQLNETRAWTPNPARIDSPRFSSRPYFLQTLSAVPPHERIPLRLVDLCHDFRLPTPSWRSSTHTRSPTSGLFRRNLRESHQPTTHFCTAPIRPALSSGFTFAFNPVCGSSPSTSGSALFSNSSTVRRATEARATKSPFPPAA